MEKKKKDILFIILTLVLISVNVRVAVYDIKLHAYWFVFFPIASTLFILFINRHMLIEAFYNIYPSKDTRLDGECYTEPIIAWRVWELNNRPYLHSVFFGYTWYPNEPLHTSCFRHPGWDNKSEISPAKGCSCGIYAKDHLNAFFIKVHMKPRGVLGLVYLWGKIIKHENGYRAEYAYPAMLFVINPKDSAEVVNLAHKYQVPFVVLTGWERILLNLGGTRWISGNHKKNLQSNLLSRLSLNNRKVSQ